MRVAVVGCGPAGLAAVHAAVGLGSEVHLYAPMLKTPQHGPLLLQRPIPGITNDHPDGYIRQIVIGGSILDYRYKLYGDVNININGDILADGYHAWHHQETYDALWSRYADGRSISVRIHVGELQPFDLAGLEDEFDLVVSTAPLIAMCMRRQAHSFRFKQVAISARAEYPNQPDDTIIFNAGDDAKWVRSSRIFGHEVTEWPIHSGAKGFRIIRKPIGHDCNCFPHVLMTGRFGAWRNEVWVDTAYWDTRNAIISATRKAEWDAIK